MDTTMYHDIESLSRQMDIPYGGVGIILWGQEPPKLMLHVAGGLSFSHLPIKAAFEKGEVLFNVGCQKTSQSMLDRSAAEQDVIMNGYSLEGITMSAPSIGDECYILEIRALANNQWIFIGRRLLSVKDDNALLFVKSCKKHRTISLHLLVDSNYQHCAKYDLAISETVLNLLSRKEQA